jgi:hypothetical protein
VPVCFRACGAGTTAPATLAGAYARPAEGAAGAVVVSDPAGAPVLGPSSRCTPTRAPARWPPRAHSRVLPPTELLHHVGLPAMVSTAAPMVAPDSWHPPRGAPPDSPCSTGPRPSPLSPPKTQPLQPREDDPRRRAHHRAQRPDIAVDAESSPGGDRDGAGGHYPATAIAAPCRRRWCAVWRTNRADGHTGTSRRASAAPTSCSAVAPSPPMTRPRGRMITAADRGWNR